jgi:hypothetical protein
MKPLLRTCLRYGLLAGTLGAILAVALYYLGKHPFLLPVVFDFRIILFGIFIFFALKEFRDFQNQGVLYFWQGFIGSYLFVLVAGLTGAVLIGIFATVMDVFVAEYITVLMKQMTEFRDVIIENVGKEAYDLQLERLPGTTAMDLAGDYFLKSMIIGFFLTVVISVVMRRHPVAQG